MWHSFGDLETYRRKSAVLDEWCRKAGRDPSEVERTWGVDANDVAGSEAFVAEGVTHFIVGVGGDGRGYDLGAVRELVQWRDSRR
jgi:hypothetical protein